MTDPEAEDPSDSHISDPQKIWIIDVCSFKVLNVWQFIIQQWVTSTLFFDMSLGQGYTIKVGCTIH